MRESLDDRIRRWAAVRPTATALVDGRGSLSYRALAEALERTARDLDVPRVPGRAAPRWGVSTGNTVTDVVLVLSLARAGLSPVLLDPRSTPAEITATTRLARLSGVLDTRSTPTDITTTTRPARLSGVPDPRSTPTDITTTTRPARLSGVLDRAAASSGPRPSSAPRPSAPRPAAPFGLVTSGTNGLPKVVRRDWASTVAVCASFADTAGYRPEDVVLCTTPLHHSYAFGIALVAGLLSGATVALAPAPPAPAELARWIGELRPTVIQSVPFLYRVLLPHLPSAGHTTRMCVSAGERLDAATADAWREASGTGLSNHYGATENAVITLADAGDVESVGRPVPGVRVRIGRPGSAGKSTEGEVWVRGPGRHSGYWGQGALTRETFTGGWQRTGDWGRLLPDGRLVLTGRLSQRVSVAGRKVDPVEVDAVLRAHPRVRDCLVTGPPTGSAETGFFAFVAASGVGELELRRYLAARLSAYKVPTRLVIRPELPRTGTNKVHTARLWRELETP
ncbi:class I adenylate-forming enzyme family protein [Streptomyces naphthomycinicus]|uniref:class I adenylate-forming enzyme family protein n=1 Tax=Streptomyces naphthomycinicus TaxID=2872625 RepID=UPI001CED0092|nr:class I adenylate-forming enzyme family protein [Streptomyces sp. TML10]